MKIKNLVKPLISLSMIMLRIFPIKNNKIIFSAFSARTYGDNPKYIAEKIVKDKLDFDCVFVLNNPTEFELPIGVRSVRHNTFNYLYEMATAGIWIDNTRKQPHILKRDGQIYIQTWHGGISFKMVERDVEESLERSYVRTAVHDSRQIDFLLTNSEWGVKHFRRCFWYDGLILKTGSARLDILFHATFNQKLRIRRDVGVDQETHILLYAPTFRKNKSLNVYDIDYSLLKRVLGNKFGGKWNILVKLHPNISGLEFDLPNYVINASLYPDINELYCITDILITDYSSSIFDYSILKRPAFLYAKDIDEYSKDRNTYFDLRQLPFSLAESNEELEKIIFDFDIEQYLIKLKTFHKDLGLMEDGHACERIIQLLDSLRGIKSGE